SSASHEDQINAALKRIAAMNTRLSVSILERVTKIMATIKPMDVEWRPANLGDHGFLCEPKDGKIEYLAHYRDGQVYYDREIYAALDQTNIAGFYVHEAANSLIQEAVKVGDRITEKLADLKRLKAEGYYDHAPNVVRLTENIKHLEYSLKTLGTQMFKYPAETQRGTSAMAQQLVAYAFSDLDFIPDLNTPVFEKGSAPFDLRVNYLPERAT